MDRDQFDRLSRLAGAGTRRGALRLLVAAAVAGIAGDRVAAAAPKRGRRDRKRGRPRAAQTATCPNRCVDCSSKPIRPGANLDRCDFDGDSFEDGVDLRSTSLAKACFAGAELRAAQFRGAAASGACFADADLRGSSFRGANVGKAVFCGADLRGADFRGSNVTAQQLACATVGCDTILPNNKPAVTCPPGQRCRFGACRDVGNGGGCAVCPDGTCFFTTIQAALDAVTGFGAEIVVCPGTYKERITIDLLASGVSIVGAGTEDTTIDAGGAGTAVTVGRGTVAQLRGLTITGGKAAAGGGILVLNRGDVTLNDGAISGNESTGSPGGGGIYNDGGTVSLSTTTVNDNQANGGQGGGIYNAGGQLILRENTQVTENRADQGGGGIFNGAGGTVSIDADSRVAGNTPNNCVGTTACGA